MIGKRPAKFAGSPAGRAVQRRRARSLNPENVVCFQSSNFPQRAGTAFATGSAVRLIGENVVTRMLYRPFALAIAALLILNMPVPVSSADAPYGSPSSPGGPGGGDVAHQGHRQRRGRPAEPVDRLRPGGRPQQHRRHPQQLAVHPAVAAGDAGAARRQHPRPDAAHRQRRRGDGHRQPARVRHARRADRRHGFRAGRRQEPQRRHAAGDAAARRRRQRLRGGAGLAGDRRLPGRGRRRQDHARRSDRRPHRQRRDHRARGRVRAQPAATRCGSRCATPTSPPPSASPPRSTISSARRPPSRSTPPPCRSTCRSASPATWWRCSPRSSNCRSSRISRPRS